MSPSTCAALKHEQAQTATAYSQSYLSNFFAFSWEAAFEACKAVSLLQHKFFCCVMDMLPCLKARSAVVIDIDAKGYTIREVQNNKAEYVLTS